MGDDERRHVRWRGNAGPSIWQAGGSGAGITGPQRATTRPGKGLKNDTHEVLGIGSIAIALMIGVAACSEPTPSAIGQPTSSSPPASDVASSTTQPSAPIFAISGKDWLDAVFGCLRQSGWNVNPTFDGGWTIELPPGRIAAFGAARAVCQAKVGPIPPIVPLNQRQIIHRYAYLLEMRACLMSLGHEISEPPPLQEFIETWPTGPWSPYLDLAVGPTEETERMCPQVEPS